MPKKLEYKYVSDYFTEHGCELLEEEYINNSRKQVSEFINACLIGV